MGNAVQALKTAAAILIFIIAITVTFTMFAKIKATTDSIVKMQDRQAYLDSAELDNGILYTSSTAIEENNDEGQNASKIAGLTIDGYRIVELNDVISALYRYVTEKYGVTIIANNEAIARFDSFTETKVNSYSKASENIRSINDELSYIKDNICDGKYVKKGQLNFDIRRIYRTNSDKGYGAPWYGRMEEILKRINCDINGQTYSFNGIEYEGKNLKDLLNNKTIVEIVRNIDNNKYIKDENNTDTSLIKNTEMPTTEIVYVVQ